MNTAGWISCVAFFLLTAGYLLAMQWIALSRSRWVRVRDCYPLLRPATRPFFQVRAATVRVNAHWYSQVADIALRPSGISIELPAPILRLRHKPILVPWDDVTAAGSPQEGMLLLRIGDDATITLTGAAALASQALFERRAKRRVLRSLRRAT